MLAALAMRGGAPAGSADQGARGCESFDFLAGASFVSRKVGFVLAEGNAGCAPPLLTTRDGGRTFRRVTDPPGAADGIVFASQSAGWVFGPGLHRTRDGARSWQTLAVDGAVESLDARANTVVAVVTGCEPHRCHAALLSSSDGGAHWRRHALPKRAPEPGQTHVQVMLLDPSTAFAVVGRRAWLTHDTGKTWHVRRYPCERFEEGALSGPYLAGTDLGNLWLVCGLQPGGGRQGKLLYRSGDGGRHWRQLGQGRDDYFDVRTPLPDSGYVQQIAVLDGRRALLALRRDTVLITTNGGRNWREAIPFSSDDRIGDQGFAGVQFVDRNRGWATLVDGAVFRTKDGGRNWQETRLRRPRSRRR